MNKIMFNDKYGLTEAVLSGRKTMTRRIAPALNHPLVSDISEWGNDDKGKAEISVTYTTGLVQYVYPQYQPGEVVAVAQPYFDLPVQFVEELGKIGINLNVQKDGTLKGIVELPGWNNKMFVRADAMPHHIRITNIKAERLQDISNGDCIKEGIEKWIDCYIVSGIMENGGKNNMTFETPREAFAALIDRISGKGTWDRNPWVFAYEFELID